MSHRIVVIELNHLFQAEQTKSKSPPQVRQRGKRSQAASKQAAPTPTPTPTTTKLASSQRRSSTVSTKSSLATNRSPKVRNIPVRFVDQLPARQKFDQLPARDKVDQKSQPIKVDQIDRPENIEEAKSRSIAVAQKRRRQVIDDNLFDSIIAVDDGCRLIDDQSKKSMTSIVRSISKQSIKKILSFDEKVDHV